VAGTVAVAVALWVGDGVAGTGEAVKAGDCEDWIVAGDCCAPHAAAIKLTAVKSVSAMAADPRRYAIGLPQPFFIGRVAPRWIGVNPPRVIYAVCMTEPWDAVL
jgi:hypothetical protein